jgi:hypothetical protein
VRCDQSADVNCVPLSDVIVCGTPNLAIQVEQNASAQAEAVMEDRGAASAHRVVRSTMVKKCVLPCEGGSGPTISTCTWEKRRSGIGMAVAGGVMCL